MGELIPIVAMLLTLGPAAVIIISVTPIGRALSARLRGDSGQLDERIAELREELRRELLEEQAAQLEDLHERIDFAERLLAGDRRGKRESEQVSTPV
jgi:hypothetical protein